MALSLLTAPAAAAPQLDGRFGDGGVARALFKGQRQDLFGALPPVRQANGKVLVASQPDPDRGPANKFLIARFTRAGALDRTFGRRGRVDITFPGQFQPLRVLTERNGRILLVGPVGGYAYFYAVPSELGIVRLLPDGSLDRSFGTKGFATWNPPWRAAGDWTFPGSVLRQPDGRFLVPATVEDPRLQGAPGYSPRAVLVRFRPDGTPDQSFGDGGFVELDPGDGCLGTWARLSDGRLASVAIRRAAAIQFPPPPAEWSLCTFAPGGSSAGLLHPTGSVPLGPDPLRRLVDLVPARDGGLLMFGDTAVRRVRPDGSLDATYGSGCSQRAPRAQIQGAAATRDGGALVSATKFVEHAQPPTVSLLIRRGPRGCVAGRPLRVRGLTVSPPLLLPGGSALIAASYYTHPSFDTGLALIKIRR